MTVVVLSNTASADTFPVRKYEDGTIAIVSNHTQITGSRTAIRGDLWLSKMNGKGISHGNDREYAYIERHFGFDQSSITTGQNLR